MGEKLNWRKSSHSGPDGGDCVEVATATQAVLVRDSKDPDGGRLAVTPGEWRRFLAALPEG